MERIFLRGGENFLIAEKFALRHKDHDNNNHMQCDRCCCSKPSPSFKTMMFSPSKIKVFIPGIRRGHPKNPFSPRQFYRSSVGRRRIVTTHISWANFLPSSLFAAGGSSQLLLVHLGRELNAFCRGFTVNYALHSHSHCLCTATLLKLQ